MIVKRKPNVGNIVIIFAVYIVGEEIIHIAKIEKNLRKQRRIAVMKSKTFVGWTHKGWCVYWDLDSLTIPYIVQTKKYYIERARRIWTKMEKPIRVEVIIREV